MKTWKFLAAVALLALAGCGAEVPDRPGNFLLVHDGGDGSPRCELLVRRDGVPDVRLEASSCVQEAMNSKIAMNAGDCGRLEFTRSPTGGPHFCGTCLQLGSPIRADGCPLAYRRLDKWQRVGL